jgi:hypothetical protein
VPESVKGGLVILLPLLKDRLKHLERIYKPRDVLLKRRRQCIKPVLCSEEITELIKELNVLNP